MSLLGQFLFGASKKHALYFDERKHIWIESMDSAKNVKAVQEWIDEQPEESKERFDFMFNHIESTTPVFEWYFQKHMFSSGS